MINIFYNNKQEKSIDKFKILENSDKYHNIRINKLIKLYHSECEKQVIIRALIELSN